jgi:hypothetical protein
VSHAKKTWDVRFDEGQHIVDLNHGEALGRVRISVDGEQVVDERTSSSADFRFHIAGRSAVVRIKQELLGFQHDYALVVEGQAIP